VEVRNKGAKLVRFFEWRGCRGPEDLADETINRVARRLREGVKIQAADPFPFFIGVAQLVLREVWRQYQRVQQLHGEPPPIPQLEGEPLEDRRLECLLECLDRLQPEERRLVLHYHDEENRIRGRRELAAELGIRLNALRIRAHRLRRRLETCIEGCLARSP
jgi:DNA-directed RNA polymerase specialized sigma24 family protein